MKIDRARFARALGDCARVAGGESLALNASGGLLHLRATNYTLWLGLSLPCEGDLAPLAINAKRIEAVANEMRSEWIELQPQGSRLHLLGERSAKRMLPTVAVECVPKIEPMKAEASIGLQVEKLHEGVAFARPFISTDISRPMLGGVHVHSIRGAVRAVGAFRGGMAFCEIGSFLTEFAATLPPAFLDAVGRSAPAAGAVFLSSDGRSVELSWDGGSVRSPVIEGAFPDYEKAIPAGDCGVLSVNADELVAATRAARGLGIEERASRSSIVALNLNGSVEIRSESEKGEAVEPVDGEWSGEPIVVGLASTQIISGLAALKAAPLRVEVRPSPAPLVFRSEKHSDRLAALMPFAL